MDLDGPMEIDTTECDGLHQNNGQNEPKRLKGRQGSSLIGTILITAIILMLGIPYGNGLYEIVEW